MHLHKTFFTLKHLKLFQLVSIFLDHPQEATLFLAKITEDDLKRSKHVGTILNVLM